MTSAKRRLIEFREARLLCRLRQKAGWSTTPTESRFQAKGFGPIACQGIGTGTQGWPAGRALQLCQEIVDGKSQVARHEKIIPCVQVRDHKRQILRRLEPGDFVAFGLTLVNRHA